MDVLEVFRAKNPVLKKVTCDASPELMKERINYGHWKRIT